MSALRRGVGRRATLGEQGGGLLLPSTFHNEAIVVILTLWSVRRVNCLYVRSIQVHSVRQKTAIAIATSSFTP
jgi:hypothetical protein